LALPKLLTLVEKPINAHPGLQHTIINNPTVNGCDRKVRSLKLGPVFLGPPLSSPAGREDQVREQGSQPGTRMASALGAPS